jgi:hypothetical protein
MTKLGIAFACKKTWGMHLHVGEAGKRIDAVRVWVKPWQAVYMVRHFLKADSEAVVSEQRVGVLTGILVRPQLPLHAGRVPSPPTGMERDFERAGGGEREQGGG